jgi:Rod binding domain-containing protein
VSASIQDPTALLAARALTSADPGREAAALLRRTRTDSAVPQDPEAVRSAAHRLEGLFASLLVKEMRGSNSTGIFGEGTGADIYGGWFDQFLGEVLAKHGELHLADSIETSLASKEAPKT